jgi:hypothetical protein
MDDQVPPKSSNVKGVIRVIMPHPDTCNGKGVEVADLIPEPAESTPPAAVAPKVYRFNVAPVDPKNWNE